MASKQTANSACFYSNFYLDSNWTAKCYGASEFFAAFYAGALCGSIGYNKYIIFKYLQIFDLIISNKSRYKYS